ncbi:MAG: DUF421 domain-containing protein [Bacteroidetes bacterium]|nr:DUF421 domain-containing protein [Bacteroidota bacterium]
MLDIHEIFSEYGIIALKSITVYIFIVIAIRLFGKKELAQLSVVDLVFILLISNSVQNAMVGNNTSLEGGLVAALALFSTNYMFKNFLLKNPRVSDFIQGKAIVLIYDGKVQNHSLQATGITLTELEAVVREHGLEEIEQVMLAMLEVDGNISVVSGKPENRSLHQIVNKHRLKGRVMK